jgi:L-lactate dehydrogenase (cytochrome)
MSICSIEDVAAHSPEPFWFQLYVMRDRGFVKDLIARASVAGCSALMLTMDLQILGQRHKDIRNGMSVPPRMTVRNLLNLMMKPRWTIGVIRTSRRQFGNIVGHVKGVSDLRSLSAWTEEQFDPTLSWKDVEWIRNLWPRTLILKGIMDGTDALQAVSCGADAVVVSNHGGRQLDGAPSAISVLPEIVDAVGHKTVVLVDGGVRSGQDVFRALALGARGTLIGRAFVYGLGALGRKGVVQCLELLRNELDRTMAMCGKNEVSEIDQSAVMLPGMGRVVGVK